VLQLTGGAIPGAIGSAGWSSAPLGAYIRQMASFAARTALMVAPMVVLGACSVIYPFDLETQALGAGAGGATASGAGGDGTGQGGDEPGGCGSHEACPTHASDNACQTTTCVAGTCTVVVAASGTPVGEQVPGDCLVVACDGMGLVVSLPDASDAPDDANECTKNTCDSGATSNPPEPSGTPCGLNGALVCDGNGACVGCNADGDCLPDTLCQDHYCDPSGGGTCEVNLVADDTPCTPDGVFCNGVEVCKQGVCFSPGDPCPGPNGNSNCAESCNEAAGNCSANDDDGSACTDGLYCTGAETCQSGACVSAGNPCVGPDGDSNCKESCNEAQDNCKGNDTNGSACNDGQYCNGNDTCQNGSCSNHTGDPCEVQLGCGPSDCFSGCDELTNTCSLRLDPGETCSCIGWCLSNGNCYVDLPY
jgi:hypothetical protein